MRTRATGVPQESSPSAVGVELRVEVRVDAQLATARGVAERPQTEGGDRKEEVGGEEEEEEDSGYGRQGRRLHVIMRDGGEKTMGREKEDGRGEEAEEWKATGGNERGGGMGRVAEMRRGLWRGGDWLLVTPYGWSHRGSAVRLRTVAMDVRSVMQLHGGEVATTPAGPQGSAGGAKRRQPQNQQGWQEG